MVAICDGIVTTYNGHNNATVFVTNKICDDCIVTTIKLSQICHNIFIVTNSVLL